LALSPFLLWRQVLGKWAYIADKDNLYYLELAAQVYYDHGWQISDPVLVHGWTPFPWLQFVPATILARTLGLGPFAVNTIWLVVAGLCAPAGVYFVFYQFLRRPWLGALCSLLVISSGNLRNAQPLIRQAIDLVHIATGRPGELFAYGTALFEQYRVVHPGLSFPLVLFQVGFLAISRQSEAKYRTLMPGIFFGLVIYSSLYDWTAIVLALAIAFVLDKSNRRCYCQVAVIGLLIGLPGIVHGLAVRQLAVGLPRTSLLLKIPRTSYLMIPKAGIALTALTAIWIVLRERWDLVYLWALGVSALALSDSARITGIELHNGHWSYVWGPVLTISFLVVLVTELHPYWRREWTAACALAVTVYVASGCYLRVEEALKTHEAVVIRDGLRDYRAQRMRGGVQPLEPGSVVAGDELFADLATVAENQRPLAGYAALQSSTMTDDEWELRWALNWYLLGARRDQVVSQAQAFASSYQWGPWSFGEVSRSQLAEGLISHFDSVSRDPDGVIQSRRVRYIAIRSDRVVPPLLHSGWRCIQQGPSWRIYEKKTEDIARRGARVRQDADQPQDKLCISARLDCSA
jgi:hypothetical protein